MHYLELVGQAAKVAVEIDGYENASPETESDANWISARIHVESQGFAGGANASFTTSDFVRFLEALERCAASVSGVATFETDEEWLGLRLTFTATGAVRVDGTVRASAGLPQTLRFSFMADLAAIDRFIPKVRQLVLAFPVRRV